MALKLGYIEAGTVIAGLNERPELTHVAVTGRGAPAELVERADLVTEMTLVHHPFREQGVKAQAGIEFQRVNSAQLRPLQPLQDHPEDDGWPR